MWTVSVTEGCRFNNLLKKMLAKGGCACEGKGMLAKSVVNQ